jgi:uncharacterized protein
MNFLRSVLAFAPTRPILALVMTLVLQVLFAVIAGVLDGALLVVKILACAIALAALLGLGKLEGRSLIALGFRNPVLRSYGLGLAGGFLLITLVVALLAISGTYRVLEIRFSSAFLLWIVILFFASIAEEFLYRGVLFRLSEDAWGTLPAIAFSSVVFGFIHATNPGASVLTSVAIGLGGGLLLGSVYVLTRNLWVVIGLHFGWNLASSVFGFSVSGVQNPGLLRAEVSGPELWTGGAFGPEAGLPTLIVALCAGVVILMYAARQGQLRGWLSPRTTRPLTASV